MEYAVPGRPTEFRAAENVLDAVLMEMSANHPRLSSAQEDALKKALLAIVVDEDGLQNDPGEIRRRFDTAMQAARSLTASE
jgi:hypothetical protein